MSLFRTALGAFKWSLVAELASNGFSMLALLVLARLLVPGEFGVVAAATIVITFSQIFVDAGLDKALIQRQQRLDECASIAFSLNLAIGVTTAVVLVLCAPLFAAFFHDERITAVVRVLALQLPIAALGTVHMALLRRNLEFKSLFWTRVVTTGASALVSIPLALSGMGYWALVAGALMGQAAQSAALWLRSPWRPKFTFDRDLARELTTFGAWTVLSGLLGWCFTWLDAIVVGRYLGANDLGLYRTGTAFVIMLFGLIFSPMLPVLYSTFSRAQDDMAKLRDAFLFVVRGITLLSLPLGAWLFAISEPVSSIVFGGAWAGVSLVIAAMGLKEGLAWIVGANGDVYRAIGKPHVDTWVNAGMLGFYLAGYLISIQFGLRAFLGTRLALTVVAIGAHVLVARVILGVPARSWFRVGNILVPVVGGLVATQIPIASLHPIAELAIRSLVFAVIVIPTLLLLERPFVRDLIQLMRRTAPAVEP